MKDKTFIRDREFRVRLSKKDKEKLEKISLYLGKTKSELVRELINEKDQKLALNHYDYA